MKPMSSMTPHELLHYCFNDLPAGVIDCFIKIIDQQSDTEEEADSYKERIEILEEQIYLAQTLIESIEIWSEENLPKTKQKQLKEIIGDSSFEI